MGADLLAVCNEDGKDFVEKPSMVARLGLRTVTLEPESKKAKNAKDLLVAGLRAITGI